MAQEEREMENSERLAVVETQVKQINESVNKMNDKLDVWNQSYVPRNEINMMFEHRDKEIKHIKHELTVEDQNKWSLRKLWPAWLGVAISLSSVFVAIFH